MSIGPKVFLRFVSLAKIDFQWKLKESSWLRMTMVYASIQEGGVLTLYSVNGQVV